MFSNKFQFLLIPLIFNTIKMVKIIFKEAKLTFESNSSDFDELKDEISEKFVS